LTVRHPRSGWDRWQLLMAPLVVIGVFALCAYSAVAGMSNDLLWFRGGTLMPDPARIAIRVDGAETLLTANSSGYDLLVRATRQALSRFDNVAPLTAGLDTGTLAEYQRQGIVVELYFSEPVNFRLPFDDGRPTALLIPIEGQFAGKKYVFRGKDGTWWAGQMIMTDPQPLFDALSRLGYIR
jgi:hypothetical protein